ncbi:MAG TPA: hypothetical protein EYH12_04165 [Psychromonas hadalis]|nr:hypothetical protein [Psychromonas hadalis]
MEGKKWNYADYNYDPSFGKVINNQKLLGLFQITTGTGSDTLKFTLDDPRESNSLEASIRPDDLLNDGSFDTFTRKK